MKTNTISEIARTSKGFNKYRNPYFGQTLQNTGWSFEVEIYNAHLGHDYSYRHTRGEMVNHPSSLKYN